MFFWYRRREDGLTVSWIYPKVNLESIQSEQTEKQSLLSVEINSAIQKSQQKNWVWVRIASAKDGLLPGQVIDCRGQA